MTAATDTDIQQIKDLITNLDKKIDGLDKKIDVGFAQVEVKLATLERKIDAGVAEVKGDIKTLDSKFEERTKNFCSKTGADEGQG